MFHNIYQINAGSVNINIFKWNVSSIEIDRHHWFLLKNDDSIASFLSDTWSDEDLSSIYFIDEGLDITTCHHIEIL